MLIIITLSFYQYVPFPQKVNETILNYQFQPSIVLKRELCIYTVQYSVICELNKDAVCSVLYTVIQNK